MALRAFSFIGFNPGLMSQSIQKNVTVGRAGN